MENENKNSGEISRRQFAKNMALAGMGALSGALTSPLSAMADQEEKIQKARREYTNTVKGKPYLVDEKVYKRFSQTKLAFNVVSREMGAPWIPSMMGNMINNAMQCKSSGTVDAGGKENARAEVAMTWSLMQSNLFLGQHGEGHENMGVLDWNGSGMAKLVPEVPPVFPPHPGPTNTDPQDLTTKIKLMARLSGADLVGICRLDPKWIYSETQRNVHTHEKPITKPLVFEKAAHPHETKDKLVIPDDTQYAIVMAYSMNRRMYQTSPSLMSQAASSIGYTRMGLSSMQMAEFIRVMGYNAIPCKNSTGLSVPMAIDAGLGEAGRHSILITPEYGPLIRLSKVLTNMPLVPDKPIEFGVEGFCNNCKKCARECPSKSITNGEKTWSGPSVCNNPGVFKWHNDLEKCLRFWVDNGTECGNCLAVCPFTKGAMWTHDATRWAIDKAKFLDPIWLTMDDAFGYGEHRENKKIWTSNISTYGFDPEQLKKWSL
jgi:reductive dehalogenase